MATDKQLTIQINRGTERAVRKLVMDIYSDLRVQTPRDTGWAAANWLGAIDQDIVETAGSPDSVDVGAQAISAATLATAPLLGHEVIISNNVPYIQRLNAGHSPQAPAGYIEAILVARVSEFNSQGDIL